MDANMMEVCNFEYLMIGPSLGRPRLDPGWGSSPFGICITQFVNSNEIQIFYAEELKTRL
jgi:hypothetical protein